MPRSIWKGSIAFGLVHIPVDLHTAEDSDELAFHQLDKRDFAPVGYERVNKNTGKKVEWANVVKGYQHADGEFVVLSKADLVEANPEATHTIDIVEFVELDEIHPMYFSKPYYLAPGKGGQKAYALLRETLERTQKAGIARVVIRTREHLAALTVLDDALVLVMLRFAHEIRPVEIELPTGGHKKLGITEREVGMAEKLVLGMVEKWKPEDFKDDYRDDVMKLIHAKVKAGEINTMPEHRRAPKAKSPATTTDLMDLLKKSLEAKPANDVRSAHASKKTKRAPKKASHSSPTRKSA